MIYKQKIINLMTIFLIMTLGFSQDITPPELVGFTFTPNEIDVSEQGQYISVESVITDDISGVDRIEFYFYSPNNQTISGGCYQGNGQLEYLCETEVLFPENIDNGIWTLGYIVLRDELMNSVGLFSDDLDEFDIDRELVVTYGCGEENGDYNNDNNLDILDIVSTVNCILSDTCDSCSDFNGDGLTDILDIVGLVNVILDI